MGIKEDFLGRERIRSVRDNIHARLTISDRKIGEAKRTGEEFLASFSSYLSENTSGILAPINPGPDQLLLAKSFASPDLLTHPKISHKTTYANSEPKIETTFAGRLDALPLALAYLQFTSLIPINGGFPESVNMNGAIGSLRDFQKEKYLFIPAVTFAFSPERIENADQAASNSPSNFASNRKTNRNVVVIDAGKKIVVTSTWREGTREITERSTFSELSGYTDEKGRDYYVYGSNSNHHIRQVLETGKAKSSLKTADQQA